MLNRILAFVALVCASATAAHAQSPGGDFCATAPNELLIALDGGWTLQQGPTTMMAAGIVMPLAPQPPVRIRFAYDSDRRIVRVAGPEIPDRMILFPAASEQAPAAAGLIAPASADNSGGCDWYALPTLIGTNVYTERDLSHVQYAQSQIACQAMTDFGVAMTTGIALPQEFLAALCGDGSPPQGRFVMEMTLVVRFASTSAGSGMVYFQGQSEGHSFRASGPVSLSR